MIMIHGRGATAAGILDLSGELEQGGFVFLAPQAEGNTWYPTTFLAPRRQNEPWLGGALVAIDKVVRSCRDEGVPLERTILLGFSQGACLALEYAARNPRSYGGVVGLSGGLIGDALAPSDYSGDLSGSVVFLGCSDDDPHIPRERVSLSAEILRNLGAEVMLNFYSDMGHTIIDDEIVFVRKMMRSLAA